MIQMKLRILLNLYLMNSCGMILVQNIRKKKVLFVS